MKNQQISNHEDDKDELAIFIYIYLINHNELIFF